MILCKKHFNKDSLVTSIILWIDLLFIGIPLFAQEPIDEAFIESELQRAATAPDSQISITVDVPIDQAFNTLLTRVHDFSETATALEFNHINSITPGKLNIGSERITSMEDGTKLSQKIIAFNPPLFFVYFTDMDKSTVDVALSHTIGYYTLQKNENDSTTADISVAYKPSSRFTGFIVRRLFNRAFQKDFKNAEALLNRE